MRVGAFLGTGRRIATASLRTGLAMTRFFTRGVVVDVRRDTWVPPYIALFCRAGPVCPAVGAGKTRSGRCGHRPLRKRILRCVGEGLCPSRGRGRTPPLRKRNKRCKGRPYESVTRGGRGERNPPVTASLCQTPLGKGAGEDGRKQRVFDTIKPPPGGGGFRRGICGEGDLRGGGLFSVGRF